jgi:hypothetical protein
MQSKSLFLFDLYTFRIDDCFEAAEIYEHCEDCENKSPVAYVFRPKKKSIRCPSQFIPFLSSFL